MAIKTKEEIVARLESLQKEKLSQKAQLESVTQLLSDLVETTFYLMDDRVGMKVNFDNVKDETDMLTYESAATSYGLESSTTGATEVNGYLTVNNVTLGNGITLKEGTTANLLGIINKGGNEVGYQGAGDMTFDNNGVTMLRVGASGTVVTNSLNVVNVNAANATGGGITLANDGEIVTLNNGYCSMMFNSGVRVYNSKGGTHPVITLGADGNISANGSLTVGNSQLTLRVPGGANNQASTLNFWSTFASGIPDTGARRTGTIKSRFSTGAWGTEVMSFHVGWSGGANDGANEPTERAKLDSGGNFTTTGNITAYSDARIKTNVKRFEGGLEKVMNLNPVTYDRLDKNLNGELGFIAQQVRDVEPNLVFGEEADGNLSLDYSRMVVLLTKALQEQQMQIEGLEQKIQDLDPS